MHTLVIVKDRCYRGFEKPGSNVITFTELRSWKRKGRFFMKLFSFRHVELRCYRIDRLRWPFYHGLIIRLLSYGSAEIRDELNQRLKLTPFCLCHWGIRKLRDWIAKPSLLTSAKIQITSMENETSENTKSNLKLNATPVYLRTDLVFGIRSGGSLGHIAGVLNNLDNYCGKPIFLTTDYIPGIRNDIILRIIPLSERFLDFSELLELHFNKHCLQRAVEYLNGKEIAFVYQRYTYNNFTGMNLSRLYKVPFILEYNGSDVWINRNWGNPLKYESISERIEMLNLNAADVIVTVSQPLKDELLARGINGNKILVNPNGVDAEFYSPDIDGSLVRSRYGLSNKLVIAFIGTFGKWHGAEVLTEAFGRLLKIHPEYREGVRLLLIGDGLTMLQVKSIIDKYGIADNCILTGLVQQKKGPQYLAAGDILVSPHVPNPDGTPFFGSPTKLFEYMAMGKGIVASNLDQIGDVLKHNETGWLVNPGDVSSLMKGLETLIDNPELRERLGKTAREHAVAKHTWKEHTRKIIEKLSARYGE